MPPAAATLGLPFINIDANRGAIELAFGSNVRKHTTVDTRHPAPGRCQKFRDRFLAFALHPLLTRTFSVARCIERGVTDLDLAGALVVCDDEAGRGDPRSGQCVAVRR